MLLADRLTLPDDVAALLIDMDGVLVDTLTMDYQLVGRLLAEHVGDGRQVPRSVIRANFAYDIPEFWRRVTEATGGQLPPAVLADLAERHERYRREVAPAVHEGIPEILQAARSSGLPIAFVSNNPAADVRQMLDACGILGDGDLVVGNDDPAVAKKPAPDPYLWAARQLGVPPARCAVIEDTLVGVEAAGKAGCHVIAVATGGNTFVELSASPYPALRYTSFEPSAVVLGRRGVNHKSLRTANDFVSHMVEHIAWRLGCSIDLCWTSDDWYALGFELGREVNKLSRVRTSTAALGMIDDGSAEVAMAVADPGGVTFRASPQVDLDWFLGVRCEQLADGGPLVSLLDGLGAAAGLRIDVTVASFEDPHHSWEGVFRAVGIALNKLVEPAAAGEPAVRRQPAGESAVRQPVAESMPAVERGWQILAASTSGARLRRETAESVVAVDLALGGSGTRCDIDVAPSIHVAGMGELLAQFADGAGIGLDVSFEATRLSSSHVVTEDIGLALGRALKCVAVERITAFGINGAGSNVDSVRDIGENPVRVGISMEGRKFWKYVPFDTDYAAFRRSFLIGHTLPSGIFTEDLDDFVDGLSGGLQASVIVHVDHHVDPVVGWPLVFRGLGTAMAELLRVNTDRKGLTAGVKATLA